MADELDRSEILYESRLDAFELYHLIVEDAGHAASRNDGPVLPALGHAVSGSAATATSKLLLYPLDLVIARLQVQKQLRRPNSKHPEYQGILDAARTIYQHEGGIGAFYTGCLADVSKGIADSFLFFLAYSFLQQREQQRAAARKQQMSVAREMGIGIIAGSFAKLITTPLQNIITRQQTAALYKAKDTEADDALKEGDAVSVMQIARQIYKERGLSGFWAGYSLSIILTLNPAITFAVDNFLHKVNPVSNPGSQITFLIAAVSKAIATSITYPVSVAKARAQAMPHTKVSHEKGSAQPKSLLSRITSLFAAQYVVLMSFKRIYERDGLPGLYSGLEAEVLKGFLSHGLTMMVKDRVHHSIIELYYFLLKLTSQWPAELRKAQNIAASVVVDARRKVQDISETTIDAGKDALDGAKDVVSDLAGNAQSVVAGAKTRAENIGVSVAEASNSVLSNATQQIRQTTGDMVQNGSTIANDAMTRADNLGTTLVEGSKQAVSNLPQSSSQAASDLIDNSKAVLSNATERASNIGTTLAEAGKPVLQDVTSRASNIGITLAETAKSAAEEAFNRVENVTTTAGELTSGVANDTATRAQNVGASIAEGGKNAIDAVKKSS